MKIKQSTTKVIRLGPFVDATDAVTPETGLAGMMTVYLSKNGATFAARNSATAPVHDRDGFYSVELDGTDTNTVGALRVSVSAPATHLPVWMDCEVQLGNVYESLVGGTEFLETTGAKATFTNSGGTLTVKKRDGTTTQYTKTVTGTAGANPITALS